MAESNNKNLRLSAFVAALEAELMEASLRAASEDPDMPRLVLAEARIEFLYSVVEADADTKAITIAVDRETLEKLPPDRVSRLTLVFRDRETLETEPNPERKRER